MKPSEVQTAVYGVLNGDATLLAMLSQSWTDAVGSVSAVFADVPQENADDPGFYPFLSIGEDVTRPFDDKDTSGGETAFQINVWTRSGDYIEAKVIAERVHALLHRQNIAITGQAHISTDLSSAEFVLDPDGTTRRGILSFSALYHSE